MARSANRPPGRDETRRALQSARRQAALAMAGGERAQACVDPGLRVVLERLRRGRSAGAMRLLAWLQGRGAGFGLEAGLMHRSGQAPSAVAAPDRSEPGRVVVRALRPVAENLLIFTTSRPPGFDFAPGQAVKLGLGGVRRSYSIVSAPHEPFLEFFVELVPGGAMSARLAALRPGESLELPARPKGSFVLDPAASRHWMIATVTGVNPFVSMLRAHFHGGGGGRVFHLLHGASYQDEFGYRDELQALAAAHPETLSYRPTVSRPDEPRNAGWTGAAGRVDALLEAYLREAGLTPADTAVYACGNPGMVEAAATRLGALGFRVRSEPYD